MAWRKTSAIHGVAFAAFTDIVVEARVCWADTGSLLHNLFYSPRWTRWKHIQPCNPQTEKRFYNLARSNTDAKPERSTEAILTGFFGPLHGQLVLRYGGDQQQYIAVRIVQCLFSLLSHRGFARPRVSRSRLCWTQLDSRMCTKTAGINGPTQNEMPSPRHYSDTGVRLQPSCRKSLLCEVCHSSRARCISGIRIRRRPPD